MLGYLVCRNASVAMARVSSRCRCRAPPGRSPRCWRRGQAPAAGRRREAPPRCSPCLTWSPRPPGVAEARSASHPVRTSMPSAVNRSCSSAETSGSSRVSSRGAASTSVTLLPSRAKACASSQPIGPPPRTTSRRGSSRSSQTVSDVDVAGFGEPRQRRHRGPRAGGDDDAPRRQRLSPGLALHLDRPRRRRAWRCPAARPRPAARSAPASRAARRPRSRGALASITSEKVKDALASAMPQSRACEIWASSFADRSSALLGTHPV